MSLSKPIGACGRVMCLTGLRRTGKSTLLNQLRKKSKIPFNWHFLARNAEAITRLYPYLASVEGFAIADEVKVQEFDIAGYDHETCDEIRNQEFNVACNQIAGSKLHEEYSREEKVAVFDILKLQEDLFWRNRLIKRGMDGRSVDPNYWLDKTISEISEYFNSSTAFDDAKVADYDKVIAHLTSCDQEHDEEFYNTIRRASGEEVTRDDKIEIYNTLMRDPKNSYWVDRVRERMPTAVITDCRFPQEVEQVKSMINSTISIRVWAPDVPMVDDPSETAMRNYTTDYVCVRAPLTGTDESNTPGELLDEFMMNYPQYRDFKCFVIS